LQVGEQQKGKKKLEQAEVSEGGEVSIIKANKEP